MTGNVKSAGTTSKDASGSKRTRLTDAERHKRFVETARKVEASDDPKDFDEAFKKVVPSLKEKPSR
jgi:hypothetical protein